MQIDRRSLMVGALAGTLAPAWKLPAVFGQTNSRPIQYIDIHTHLGAFHHGLELTARTIR